MRPLVGAIHSGRPGRSPFDSRVWSSSSRRLFSTLRDRGALRTAIGVELSWSGIGRHVVAACSRSLSDWKARWRLDVNYRKALTRRTGRMLRAAGDGEPVLQIGAMFDTPRLLAGRAPCYSYHDGNLMEWLHSSWPVPSLGAKAIDRLVEFERQVYLGMTRLFTFSQFLTDSLVRNYGVPSDRITTVGAGTNLDRWPEVDPKKRYDTNEILFVGTDFERKGGQTLLAAFARTRERVPSAILNIVGPTRVRLGSTTAGVRVHGFLSRTVPAQAVQLEALFQRASLFVLPSLYEPFGMAVVEAMAYALPSVVTGRWALSETVVEGETGLLTEPANAEQLSDAMTRLLLDPDRSNRMGRAGRQRAERFDRWEAVVDRMLQAISGADRTS